MNNSTTEQPSSMVDGPLCVSMIVINTFSGLLATVLNLLVIMTFVKTPSLRTPSNILILSLAITDFCVGALVQPVYCAYLFADMTNNTIVYQRRSTPSKTKKSPVRVPSTRQKGKIAFVNDDDGAENGSSGGESDKGVRIADLSDNYLETTVKTRSCTKYLP
ncbi:Ocellar opsin [Exaiptasia diaphana]|nr:Ocellar opsin [Exaiptasia diaphana]